MSAAPSPKLDPSALSGLPLKSGGHDKREDGVCAMEAVAWLAGEPHTDHPACTSPVIGAFIRSWNDTMKDDEERNRLLRPILPRLLGTVGSKEVESRRAYLCQDWYVRTWAPAWLDLAGHKLEAQSLRDLSEIRDLESMKQSQSKLERAKEVAFAAWSAAWSAARSAARSAAESAARRPVVTALVKVFNAALEIQPEVIA